MKPEQTLCDRSTFSFGNFVVISLRNQIKPENQTKKLKFFKENP